MRKIFLPVLLVLALATGCQMVSGEAPAVSAEGIVVDRTDQTLKAENEALRRENQLLRRELVAKKGVLPESLLPQAVVEPTVDPVSAGEDTGFWLSERSKIRHNARCRNYRQAKGRPCGPQDGRPCKTCGG